MPPIKPFDFDAIRQRLTGRLGQSYWRSMQKLTEEPGFGAFLDQEFPRLAKVWNEPIDRRAFLKVSAAAMALSGLAACSRQPPEEIVPYVWMPERMIPGKPLFYATTLSMTGPGVGVLVETHEGRPLRIRGNPGHPGSLGGLDVFNQAAILDLYDPDRTQSPLLAGEPVSYAQFRREWTGQFAALKDQQGQGLHILTPELNSPSAVQQLQDLLSMLPQAKWYVHAPFDQRAGRQGAMQAFGRELQSRFHLDKAACIVALDADFLGSMAGALHYARDYASRRSVHDDDRQISRLYAIESQTSITGAKADHRLGLKPAEVEAFALALAQKLGLPVQAPDELPVAEYWLDALVQDLQAHTGQSLVIAGEQQTAPVHALAHAINAKLGNAGQTVEYFQSPLQLPSEGLRELQQAITAGQVDHLLILGGNPAHDAPGDLDFKSALSKVKHAVYWGVQANETASLCRWVIPAAHPLESWGDAIAYDGSISPMQPVVQPIYGGIELLRFLAELRGDSGLQPRQIVRDYWQSRVKRDDFDAYWNRALHDGIFEGVRADPVQAQLQGNWAESLKPTPASSGLQLRLAPDPSLWDGSFANNAWLQELPRPLTKTVWGNALLVSPVDAMSQGLSQDQLVRISTGQQSLDVPVHLHPGQPAGVVGLSLGGGRTAAGRVGNFIGVNAYPLRTEASPWFSDVKLEPTEGRRHIVTTQHHHAMQGRDDQIARQGTLQELVKQAAATADKVPTTSLYREHAYESYAWGMSINIESCIGCNACVIACQSENNVPSVGAEQVSMGREMHWIRIDRYYKGEPESPTVVLQPVLCMHCEKAPCEYVCPMHATTHSSEGLNEMTYNRCIGTRDCSQNCPYKVRRFNFLSYTGKDALTSAVIGASNPDVTVRSRGVMEKCTYCVQRINEARMGAQKEGRRIGDGEFTTACAEACPTRAIVFGDINDPASQVSRLKASNLDYAMLAELNTRPRTSYLPGLHNPNPEITRREGN